MYRRTGEIRYNKLSNRRQEKCICSCGKIGWVYLRNGELRYEKCHACASFDRRRSKPEDTHRTCRNCLKSKLIEEFCTNKTGKYLCLECKRHLINKSYELNPNKIKNQVNKRYKSQRNFMIELKSKPCEDCGKTFHWCQMDFDHIDPLTKNYNIARIVGQSKENILKEIALCRLLCANCHRTRTQNELVEGFKTEYKNREKPNKKELESKLSADEPNIHGEPTQICRICNKSRSVSFFEERKYSKSIGRRKECKTCKSIYTRKYREENVEYITNHRKNKVKKNCEWYDALKDNQPCVDCGEIFRYWCLDYDHLYNKEFKISRKKHSTASREVIIQEIAKCRLRCANCHRLKTFNERK